eukprot:756749-Hanusia_phi.AAC.9
MTTSVGKDWHNGRLIDKQWDDNSFSDQMMLSAGTASCSSFLQGWKQNRSDFYSGYNSASLMALGRDSNAFWNQSTQEDLLAEVSHPEVQVHTLTVMGCELRNQDIIMNVIRDGDLIEAGTSKGLDLGKNLSVRERYKEVKRYKGGVMGTVYKAQDTASKGLYREVVVKLLQNGASKERQEHPNIISYIDMGQEPDGTSYIVMEAINGPDLQQVLDKRGFISEEETINVVIGILQGLVCTHAHGVVHRDLKPANVLVILETLHVKIIDFGLARELSGGSLLTGENVVGTPMYFAPEQTISGAEITTVTDLWAVGVLIYHCVTGTLPFAKLGDPLQVIVNEICTKPVPNIVQVSGGRASEQLRSILDQALQKRPQNRIATAEIMLARLRDLALVHQTLRSQSATRVIPNDKVQGGPLGVKLHNEPQNGARDRTSTRKENVMDEREKIHVLEMKCDELSKINADYHQTITTLHREARDAEELNRRLKTEHRKMKDDLETEARLRKRLEEDLKAALDRSEKEKQKAAVLQVESEDARAVLKDRTEHFEEALKELRDELFKANQREATLIARVGKSGS